MFKFKNYIALFLLLLFVRILVPEAAVLALHSHEHTEEHVNNGKGFKVETKHLHCPIDHLFNAPFTPTHQVIVIAIVVPFTDTYSADHSYIWKFTFPNNTDLRGPPVV